MAKTLQLFWKSLLTPRCITVRNMHHSLSLGLSAGSIKPSSALVPLSPKHIFPEEGETEEEEKIMSKYYKEPQVPHQLEAMKRRAVFDMLQEANSIDEIFDVYKESSIVYTEVHFMKTLEHLIRVISGRKDDLVRLHSDERFLLFCFHLWKQVSRYSVNIIVALISHFDRLEIDKTSVMMLSLFQLLRHLINDLDVKEIVFMNLLLKKFPEGPLVTALQKALPLTLELKLEEGLNVEMNIWELAKVLDMCVHHQLSNTGIIVEKICKKAVDNPDALGGYSEMKVAYYLLKSLLGIPAGQKRWTVISREYESYLDFLVTGCFEELTKNHVISTLQPEQILSIMLRMSIGNHKGDPFAYDEKFMCASSRLAMSAEWSAKQKLELLHYQLKMNWLDEALIHNTVAQLRLMQHRKSEVDPSILAKIHAIVAAIVSCQEKPKNFRSVILHMISAGALEQPSLRSSITPCLEVALNLLTLGIYPKSLLTYLCTEALPKRLNEDKDKWKVYELQGVHLLHIVLQDIGSPLQVPDMATNLISNLSHAQPPQVPELTTALKIILKEQKYFATNVYIEDLILVDYLICLDENSQYLPINPESKCEVAVEDLQIPGSRTTEKLVILCVPRTLILPPNCKLKGKLKLLVQLIEKRGYKVGIVPETMVNTRDIDQMVDFLCNLVHDLKEKAR